MSYNLYKLSLFCCLENRLGIIKHYMSRAVPWRSKPTTLITQMIPVANEYKLYLVHETGPTSFIFKDDNDNKFKVSIGANVMCSCGIVQNDHCIHTLYVLLKKFRVPSTNPIVWQASYLDSELEGFVQFKYAEKRRQPIKKHQFKKTLRAVIKQQAEDFPPLEEDSMCPICYEDMNGQCYSSCKTCRKSMHTKCFKIWTRHKEDSGVAVTCPMCRSQFQNPMVVIYKDLQRWDARFSTHKGTLCKGCGVKNIKGAVFKCLLCSGIDLCKMCFQANQHSEHDKYFMKILANDQWKAVPQRIKKNKKQMLQLSKDITGKQLSQFQTEQFILDLFPTLKEYNSTQTMQDLGIVGNQILPKQLCFKCKTGGNESMRRLQCGHALHQECLKSMISNKQYLCEIDDRAIAVGYFQAIGIKIAKSRKKPVECVILKNEEQMNKIKDNINQFEIDAFIPKTKINQKRNYSVNTNQANKSKDKNFRILKKNALEKRQEPLNIGVGNLGLIMVTGLGQQICQPSIVNGNQGMNLPPKLRSKLKMGSYR